MKRKFLLIDGTALVFRGFYAIPPLKTSAGLQTNAIYGFYTILLNLLIAEKPTHIAVCFDRKEETTRKKEYSDYKATRTKAPDELYAQIGPIKDILKNGNLKLVEKAGIEADDLIATLAKEHEPNEDTDIFIYSSDLDLIQLVNKVKIIRPGNAKTGNTIFDIPAVQRKYGFTPNFIPDYKGLHGDPSDNLPGIKGVGQKTAAKLIQEYGHLEDIYKNIDRITGTLKQRLIDGKEAAFFCRKLATLHTDIEMETRLSSYDIGDINFNEIETHFDQLEISKLSYKLEKLKVKVEKVKDASMQQTLF